MITTYDFDIPKIDTLVQATEFDSFTIRNTPIVDDIRKNEVGKDLGEDNDSVYLNSTLETVKNFVTTIESNTQVLVPSTIPQQYGIGNLEGNCAIRTNSREVKQEVEINKVATTLGLTAVTDTVTIVKKDIEVKESVFRLDVKFPYKVSKLCMKAKTYDTTFSEFNTNSCTKMIKLARTDVYHEHINIVWRHYGQREFAVVNDIITSEFYGQECELELGPHNINTNGMGGWVNQNPPDPTPQTGQSYVHCHPALDNPAGGTCRPAGPGDVIPQIPDLYGNYIYDVCSPCGNAYGSGSFWALGGYINDEVSGWPYQKAFWPYREKWDDPSTQTTIDLGPFAGYFAGKVPAYLLQIDAAELATWLMTGVKPASGKIGLRCKSIFHWNLSPKDSWPGGKKFGTENFPENYINWKQAFHPKGGYDSSAIEEDYIPMSICETGDRTSNKRSLYMFMGDRFFRSIFEQNTDLTMQQQYEHANPQLGSDGVSIHPAWWEKREHNQDFPYIFAIGKGNNFSSENLHSGGIYWTYPDYVIIGPQPNKHHAEIVWDPSVVNQPVSERDHTMRRLIFLNGEHSSDLNKVSGEKGTNSSGVNQEINHANLGGTYEATDCESVETYDAGLWANEGYTGSNIAVGSIRAVKGGDIGNIDQTGMYLLYRWQDFGSDCRTDANGAIQYFPPIPSGPYVGQQYKGIADLNSKLETSAIQTPIWGGGTTGSASWAGTGQCYPGNVYAEKHQGETIKLGTNVGFVGKLTWLHFTSDGYDWVDDSIAYDSADPPVEIDVHQSYVGMVCWANGWRVTDAGTITSTASRTAAQGTPSGTDDYEWTAKFEDGAKCERVNGLVLITYPARKFNYEWGGAHALKIEPGVRFTGETDDLEFLYRTTDLLGNPLDHWENKTNEWIYTYDDLPMFMGNGTPVNITSDLRTFLTADSESRISPDCKENFQIVQKDCASEMVWDSRDAGTNWSYDSDWMRKFIPATYADKLKYTRQHGYSPRWQVIGGSSGGWNRHYNEYGPSRWRLEDYHIGGLVFSETSNTSQGYKQFIYPGKISHPKPTIYGYQNYAEYNEDQLGNFSVNDVWSPENYWMARDYYFRNYDSLQYISGSSNPYLLLGNNLNPLRRDFKQLIPQNYLFYPKAMQDQLPKEWDMLESDRPEFSQISHYSKNHFYKLNYGKIRFMYFAGLSASDFADEYTLPNPQTMQFQYDLNREFSDNTRYEIGNMYGLIVMNDTGNGYGVDDAFRELHHFSVRFIAVNTAAVYYPQLIWDDETNNMEQQKFNEAVQDARVLNGNILRVKFNREWIDDNFVTTNNIKVCIYKARVLLGDQHLGFYNTDTIWWDMQNEEVSPLFPDYLYGNSITKRGTGVATSIEAQGWTRGSLEGSLRSVCNYATRGRNLQISSNVSMQTTRHHFGEVDLMNTLPTNALYFTTNYDGGLANQNCTIDTTKSFTTFSDVSIYEYNSGLGTSNIPDQVDLVVLDIGEQLQTWEGDFIWV